ncbi:glyoxalase superfamily protein [Arsenicicoccus dermatophilus]|uniref:glyoxalase superfamily protein n=1 Tax=Arsenicicoccus dermatophilus TaxID=1076331 RepID=UPI0039174B02
MITTLEAKSLARELSRSSDLTHSAVLEAVAHAAGFRDWNTFCARQIDPTDAVGREQVVPVLRIFDAAIAREFYADFLGFRWVWEHRHEPDLPVYAEVERAGSVLHLTEHHGDATPGGRVMLVVNDVRGYCEQLTAARHRRCRPAVLPEAWGLTMTVDDPFGNRLTSWERGASAGTGTA